MSFQTGLWGGHLYIFCEIFPIEDPNWSDVELGVDKWSIHNKESGDWDGAYLAPYMYQV